MNLGFDYITIEISIMNLSNYLHYIIILVDKPVTKVRSNS